MSVKCGGFLVLACLLAGCVDFRVESENDMPTTRTNYRLLSVRAEDFTGIRPRLVRTTATQCRFSLECTGTYRLERERTTEGERMGKHMLSIGLFPGLFWMSDAYDGTDYSEWPLGGLKVILANGVMAGVPTILSLFYAPFDSYHDAQCGVWSKISGYGLLGSCKRIRQRAWSVPIRETCRETVSQEDYVLSDYTVLLQGLPYHCEKGGKSVVVTVPEGEDSVTVQIRSVPKLAGELGRYVESISRTELEVDVERQ